MGGKPMRILRGLLGALLWIPAALLGLVGLVLCVTIILLPVGIPVLGLACRLFRHSVQVMLPRAVSHPFKEATKKGEDAGSAVTDTAKGATKKAKKKVRNKTTKRTLLGRKRKSPI